MLNTLFRDFALLVAMAFMFMVFVLVQHLNKPTEVQGLAPPGNVVATINWPRGDIDIDLWVTGPGEPRPIGYSNVNGLLFNLLRDDQGEKPDLSGLNYENAYSRGAPPGEYIVNVHCFSCEYGPVNVDVEVVVRKSSGRQAKIGVTRVQLLYEGDEQTAMRFTLDGEGDPVPGSINHLYRPLRVGTK